jgi:hypothetical protein
VVISSTSVGTVTPEIVWVTVETGASVAVNSGVGVAGEHDDKNTGTKIKTRKKLDFKWTFICRFITFQVNSSLIDEFVHGSRPF